MNLPKIGRHTKNALRHIKCSPTTAALFLSGNMRSELLKKGLATCKGAVWRITDLGLAALIEQEKQDKATNKRNKKR